jgi:predicted nucleic acid-binding protein
MATVFLDTNVLLRHLLQDHPEHSPKATAFLERIERGDVQARISDVVIMELAFTLQRSYKQPKAQIRDVLLALLDLPGLELPGKRRYRKVFDLYVDLNISFADAYHAVLMQQLGIQEVISFDRDFDRVPWAKRSEP